MSAVMRTCVRKVGAVSDGSWANVCTCGPPPPKTARQSRFRRRVAATELASGPDEERRRSARDRSPRLAGSRRPGSNLTCEMGVTLFERHPTGPIRARALKGTGRRRRKLMEKFVIEGGAPLSGTMVPAGNKNGALPILASSILTAEEVLVRN